MGCCGGPRPQNNNVTNNNSEQENQFNAFAGTSKWLIVGLVALLAAMLFFR